MKIVLEEQDLNKAIFAFIEKTGLDLTGKTVDIDLTVGRGSNGNSATVDINDAEPLNANRVELPVNEEDDSEEPKTREVTKPVFGNFD